MKNIIKYAILSILAISLFASCKKDSFLTRNNPNATTDAQFWQTQAELSGYLDQVYFSAIPGAVLTSYNFTYSNGYMESSGITDESVYRANYNDWQNFVNGTASSSSDVATQLYALYYQDIRNSCRILENYRKIYITDTALLSRYGAEARALRAYSHLKLFRLWGPVPIVTSSLTVQQAESTPRPTQEQMVSFISGQLDSAAAVLPTTYPTSDAKRITKGACYAMQVQLYLAVKDYAHVIAYAQKLIALNQYSLYVTPNPKANSYAELFGYNALYNNEEILICPQGCSQTFLRYGPASSAGEEVLSPTATLVNTYETKQGKTLQELGTDSLKTYWANPLYHNNRDPRMSATIMFPGQKFEGVTLNPFNSLGPDPLGILGSTFTGYFMHKYVDSTDVSRLQQGTINYMVIRYPEILLSYVEALVESGEWQNPDVKKYINMIRNRAGMPNYDINEYNSQATLQTLYRRERMVELSFEDSRLYDIRRWGIGSTVLNGEAQGAINPSTGQPVNAENRIFIADRDNLWPIPLTEIQDNTGIKQNPGW